MAIRPFYILADIEGRKTSLSGGPKSADGDVDILIYQRDNGVVTNPYKIVQRHKYGDKHKLVTEVHYQGKVVHSHITDY